MATQIGVIKQVSGVVVAVDENGTQRVLKAGDALFLGEVIKTSSAASKAVVAMDNGKDVTILGNESVKLDNSVLANSDNTVADVSDLQKALLDGKDLTKLEETAAGGGNAAAGGGDGVSLGAASFEHGGHYSNISADTSAINPLGAGSFAGPVDNVGGGASGAGNVDPDLTRKPGTPSKPSFPEDANKDGIISDAENRTGDKPDNDPSKTPVVAVVPTDGSVKPGDKLVIRDGNGKKIGEKEITKDDLDNGGKVTVPDVPVKPGDNTITAEIVNPKNPDNPSNKSEGKIIEDHEAPTAPTVEFIDDTKKPTGTLNKEEVGTDGETKAKISFNPSEVSAGDKVDYTVNGKEQPTHTLTEAEAKQGFITVDVPVEADATSVSVTNVVITDQADNASKPGSGTIAIDTSVPTVENLKVTPVDTDSPANGTIEAGRVTGHSKDNGEPLKGANVVIKDGPGENANIIGEGKTDGAGNFDIITTTPVQPGQKVYVEITDAAGNTGKGNKDAGNSIEHSNDHEAPTAPTVEFIDDTKKPTGTLNKEEVGTDGETKAKISFNPSEVSAGDKVDYTVNGKEQPTHTLTEAEAKQGFITVDVPVEADATSVSVTNVVITDQADNASKPGSGTIAIDTSVPETPEVTFVEDGDGNKILSKTENSEDFDSKHTTVKISTKDAIAGDKIDYSINGKEQPTHTLTEAEVQKGFIEVKVPVGNGGDEIRVEAKIVDQAGNPSGSKDASLTVGSWIDLKLGTIELDESSKPGGGAAKKENKHDRVISLTDGNDNMIVKTGLFTNGSVLNAGNGNDHVLITGALGSVGAFWDSSIHGTVNLGEGGSVITKASAISIDSNVPNARFVIKNGAGEVIGEGTTNNEGKFDGDLKLSKAIMPKDKITAEITDKDGNVLANDTEIVANVSGLEAGGRYYNNLLEIGTDIDHGKVNAGAGNDKVVTGVIGGSGHITGHSYIDLGDGDNELEVKTNIDDSIVKAGSGDDIVTVHNWVRNGSDINLGDGNNTLTVDYKIVNSTVTTGKGDDTVDVKNGAIIGTTVNLGKGDDTVIVGNKDITDNLGNKSNIEGGDGYDKLIITDPGTTINLSNIASQARDFEEINISNKKQNTTVNVTLKDVMDITDSDHVLAITGDSGDKVSLTGGRSAGWKEDTSGDYAKYGYKTYTNTDDNGNTVFVQIKNEVDVPL